jgi:NADH dehydrogenase FAD-containing subunit
MGSDRTEGAPRPRVVVLGGGFAGIGATKAFLAWGAVHLALLSTGEDRAKALIEWTWAGFSHERSARITVRTDERASG